MTFKDLFVNEKIIEENKSSIKSSPILMTRFKDHLTNITKIRDIELEKDKQVIHLYKNPDSDILDLIDKFSDYINIKYKDKKIIIFY